MDIHEIFSHQVPKLKKLVEDIEKSEKEELERDKETNNIIIDDNYMSEWDRFAEFLRGLFNESFHDDRLKKAIFWLMFDNDELDLHEQIEEAFNHLTEYDDKILKKVVYIKDSNEITIKYNEIKDEYE